MSNTSRFNATRNTLLVWCDGPIQLQAEWGRGLITTRRQAKARRPQAHDGPGGWLVGINCPVVCPVIPSLFSATHVEWMQAHVYSLFACVSVNAKLNSYWLPTSLRLHMAENSFTLTTYVSPFKANTSANWNAVSRQIWRRCHTQISCLCLLDLSAAFDTIDHNI